MDDHYPDVDEDFFLGLIRTSPKIDPTTERKVGTSYTFLKVGDAPVRKRMITFRSVDGKFSYIQATNKAILLNLLPQLMDWLEEKRNWKDGAYFEP